MREYLDAHSLGRRLTEWLQGKELSRTSLAQTIGATQGEVSKILLGRFKTENSLVARICKYANIPLDEFRISRAARATNREAVTALSLACKGRLSREKAVVRILRAIQELD